MDEGLPNASEQTDASVAGGANTPVEAAVLVPCFRDDQREVRLVLVARGPGGIHGGQVALPGGRLEASDSSPLEAALRETEEEIGLGRSAIDVLAALEPLDTRSTGFRVHPFIARVRVPERWQPSPDEVTAVLSPRLKDLVDPERRQLTTVSFPNWPAPRQVECVVLDEDHTIWGLTLRLLARVVPSLLTNEWSI